MAKDVAFPDVTEDLNDDELQYELAVYIQQRTCFGVMTTNGQHRVAKAIMIGENWKETTETAYIENPIELRNEESEKPQVPKGSILYQCVTVNIHYPTCQEWNEDVLKDLKEYSKAEDGQGKLQNTLYWKDAVQDAVTALTHESPVGYWNWDENHYLGNVKMYPLDWRDTLRRVYKVICQGTPARDYILPTLVTTRKDLAEAYGNVPTLIGDYVETVFSDLAHISKRGLAAMSMENPPKNNYPQEMIPMTHGHFVETSRNFSPDNCAHYLRVIMFGCYNGSTKNVMDSLAYQNVAVAVQANGREYLPARNLFDNELLVVAISRTVVAISKTYSAFLHNACGVHSLTQVLIDDKTFFANMAQFLLTAQLLDRANRVGINPAVVGKPEYYGFDSEDVQKYGYYFLFVMNLPAYAESIWTTDNADYLNLMNAKERRAFIKQHAGEEEKDSSDEEEDENDPWKNVKKFKLDMRFLNQLMKVTNKVTIKKTAKKTKAFSKCSWAEWDAIPWDPNAHETVLDDLPLKPTIAEMWKSLFDSKTKTPLQKIMVAVNRGSTKKKGLKKLSNKELIEILDTIITKTEHDREKIERIQETCDMMKVDMAAENEHKGGTVPERFIYRTEQIGKDAEDINTKLSATLTNLQDLRHELAPKEREKAAKPAPAKKTPAKGKKRKRN